MYDMIIIGSGITGAFIAHELSKYQLNVLILEKELEVGNGVSKANSAIIHSGFNSKPGSLKAKLNVLGNKMYQEITKKLNVKYKQIGSYTLAFSESEFKRLKTLQLQGKENGVVTELIDKKQLLEIEPHIKETVKGALYAPNTGIISPWHMIYALLENAIGNGIELKTNHEVIGIKKEENHFVVDTTQQSLKCRYVINAAGLSAYDITSMVTNNPGYKMIYTKGDYYVLDKTYQHYVKHVLYPTPTEKGKGVLVVPTIDGNILLGPTSEVIENKDHTGITKEGVISIRSKLDHMMKKVPYEGIIHSFSGIRPKTTRHDFIIEELKDVPQFIQVAGIESPGLASSPAISLMVLEIIKQKEKLEFKKQYKLIKQKSTIINELPIHEINRLIKENPKYGRIICYCENITEGEIIDAIKGPLGTKTIDGIKRRVRPGAGRCQGGFCQGEIIRLLAQELKVNKIDILLDKEGSNILFNETTKGVGMDV